MDLIWDTHWGEVQQAGSSSDWFPTSLMACWFWPSTLCILHCAFLPTQIAVLRLWCEELIKLKAKCKPAEQRTLCVMLKMYYFCCFGRPFNAISLAISGYDPGMYAKRMQFLHVRYPLSSYLGIWNSHVGTLPLHTCFLARVWHMAHYTHTTRNSSLPPAHNTQ